MEKIHSVDGETFCANRGKNRFSKTSGSDS